jgi:GT2 family glycosyltransferase
MPKVSVVLATYKRADTLRRTLLHLDRQDVDADAFEVIVVDDGSPDHTPDVVADFAKTARCAVTSLRHDNRGAGYTQNRGIHAARAPLVLLIADDIWLRPEALRAHLDVHREHPESEVAVLGKVVQSPELTQTAFLRRFDPWGLDGLHGVTELPFTMFWACNVSVKKAFMLRGGLFREDPGPAGPHAHHDTELGYRLHRLGLRLLFCERALGFHYHHATFEQVRRQYYERGLNWPWFREQVPAPEALVLARLLTLDTLPEFARALRAGKRIPERDRSLARHVARTLLRNAAFNRVTVPMLWEPLRARADASRPIESLLGRGVYRGLLHYHFERGIRDAARRSGDSGARRMRFSR